VGINQLSQSSVQWVHWSVTGTRTLRKSARTLEDTACVCVCDMTILKLNESRIMEIQPLEHDALLNSGNQSEHSRWSDAAEIDTVGRSAPTCSHQQCRCIWKMTSPVTIGFVCVCSNSGGGWSSLLNPDRCICFHELLWQWRVGTSTNVFQTLEILNPKQQQRGVVSRNDSFAKAMTGYLFQ